MIRTIKGCLFPFGINITRQTHRSTVLDLIRALRPLDCGIELVRIGGPNDGGYLIPDDLAGIEYCFSPGVSNVSNFEDHLAELHIRSFLADYSVDAPPKVRPEFTFDKRYVGATDDEKFFTLGTWKDKYLKDYPGDLILQMDIEDYEYHVILNASPALLNQFRILVIEFHHLDRLFDRFDFKLLSSCFRKLLDQFYVVHIHPNNLDGSAKRGNVEVPRLMEFTFLNKRRALHTEPQKVFPHPLDMDNTDCPPLHLPKCWYSDGI